MEHYLFVDATGQLADVCLHFAGKVKRVSMISGDQDLLEDLRTRAQQMKLVISQSHADLVDSHQLRHAIEALVADNGPADVTVAALGKIPPEAAAVIAQTLRDLAVFTEFFDVGSHDEDRMITNQREGRLRSFENVWYRKIEVGFILDNGTSRWPSSEEVTNGVIQAVDEKTAKTIIGQTEPAERRPK
jgi:hypothetical protein